MSFLQAVLGKKLSPDELVKKWRQNIRTQERELDKSIRGIEKEELKTKNMIKQAAKRKDMVSAKLLAKEVVQAKKAKSRLITSKAQLNSLLLSMQQQLATVKVTGALTKSTEVMKLVNRLVKLPEISAQMEEMSKEMMKAGIIEEMVTDTLDMDDEELEQEADEQVEQVLFELTDGLLGQAGAVGGELPANDEVEKRLKALQAI